MKISSGWASAIGGGALAFATVLVWLIVPSAAPAPERRTAPPTTDVQSSLANTGNPGLRVVSGPASSLASDQLVLSKGKELRIHWRKMPLPRMEISPPFADDYVRLREMALNGSAAAAYVLSKILDSCQFGYSDREPYEAAMEMLKKTHYLLVPGRKEAVLLTDLKVVKGWQGTLRTLHQQCQGITEEAKAEVQDWVAMAADSGMPIAMARLSDSISDYARGVALDEARWRTGDAAALRSLAMRYYGSYNSGEHPENETKYYAALYAYTQIALARFSNPTAREAGRDEHVSSELDAAARKLLPHQRAEALTMAEEILRSNPNCCFAF